MSKQSITDKDGSTKQSSLFVFAPRRRTDTGELLSLTAWMGFCSSVINLIESHEVDDVQEFFATPMPDKCAWHFDIADTEVNDLGDVLLIVAKAFHTTITLFRSL